MNNDLDHFDSAIHAIYAASLEPQRWPEAIRSICTLCGASSALLFTWAHSPSKGGFTFAHNISPAAMEFYASKMMLEDPFVQAAVKRKLTDEGTVVLGDELVSRTTLVATPFYKELWQPLGISGMCTSVVFDGTDSHKLPTAFTIYHGESEVRFNATQVGFLKRVLPHVSRALGVMFHLRDQQRQAASSLGALERLPGGVLLLDGQRKVRFANPVAAQILRQGDGFFVEDRCAKRDTSLGGTLRAIGELHLGGRLKKFEPALQRAISDALGPWSVRDTPDHFSRALVLPNQEGRPQYVLHVAPLGSAGLHNAFGENTRAIVFAYDMNRAASVQTDALCELFGLTQAEARAALQVLKGGSTADMAERLNVSVNTLKTQLQAAFDKTRTNRQVDLLKLLLSLATG